MTNNLKRQLETAVVEVKPFIERIYISTKLQSIRTFDGSFVFHEKEHRKVKSEVSFIKHGEEKFRGILKGAGNEQKVLIYEHSKHRKQCYIHVVNPDIKKLRAILDGANCDVILARYSLDFLCSSLISTRHVYDTILNYGFFPDVGQNLTTKNKYHQLDSLPSNIASKFSISKGNEILLNKPRIVIKECSQSLREKAGQLSNKRIDRVRISIWKGGYKGAKKIPLDQFSTHYLHKTIQDISLKKIRPRYLKQYPFLRTNAPLMDKVKHLKNIKSKYNDLLDDASIETAHLKM